MCACSLAAAAAIRGVEEFLKNGLKETALNVVLTFRVQDCGRAHKGGLMKGP